MRPGPNSYGPADVNEPFTWPKPRQPRRAVVDVASYCVQSTHQPACLDKLTTPRLAVDTASKPNAPSFLMRRGGGSADARLAPDVLSVKAVPVDLSTFAAIQDGKHPNASKRESHRE